MNLQEDAVGNKPKFDFECGDCAALAIALHRETGLPMYAVIEYNEAV
jgi:hypothetical protein